MNERVYTVMGTYWNTLYPDCVRNIHAVNGHGYTVSGITDFSFPRMKGPYGELSFPKNESSWNFRSQDLSGPSRSPELSFLAPFVPGNFRSHRPIGLVAALHCVITACSAVTSPLCC